MPVAAELCRELKPYCDRIIVAGSLRRRKESVGDVEILYISKLEKLPELQQADLLAPPPSPRFLALADARINGLAGFYRQAVTGKQFRTSSFIITHRKNSFGSITWGEKNKYARHIASGIPVDFFRATEENWFNLLVCRTGSAENNTRLASAYRKLGCEWHPCAAGYTNEAGQMIRNDSERAVFANARLHYLEPWER